MPFNINPIHCHPTAPLPPTTKSRWKSQSIPGRNKQQEEKDATLLNIFFFFFLFVDLFQRIYVRERDRRRGRRTNPHDLISFHRRGVNAFQFRAIDGVTLKSTFTFVISIQWQWQWQWSPSSYYYSGRDGAWRRSPMG